MTEIKSEQQKLSFFIFINTKSGGGLGRKYLTVTNRKLSYQFGNKSIYLYLIDLFDQQERERGLTKMQRLFNKGQLSGHGKVTAIICGGDGTVLWVVSLVGKQGIDLTKVTFCIIPIGTGNDFSRCLGWGGSPISFSAGKLNQLKQRLLQWLSAEQSWFDIWDSTLTVYQDGEIFQIRDKRQVSTGQKTLMRGFCNYYGVGIDARICYYVQKNRKQNKWFNLCLYGCIGLCKLFQKIRPTNEAINNFRETDEQSDEPVQSQKQNTSKEDPLLRDSSSICYIEEGGIQLKHGYGNLLALNSIRYMAGLQNVWDTNKLGILTENPPQFTEQKFDDGKIEFLGFKNELRLGLQRVGNFGARIAQGPGPFSIDFNRTESNNIHTYIHIDGEAMKIRQLKQISIRKSSLAPNGRIRVLIRRQQ